MKETIEFITDSKKVITFNLNSIKSFSEISNIQDGNGGYEFSCNIFYKNGKMKFLKTLNRIKVMRLLASIDFMRKKESICANLQASF